MAIDNLDEMEESIIDGNLGCQPLLLSMQKYKEYPSRITFC